MTEERAAEIVSDVSYFGTIMVHPGMADGMFSGAHHRAHHCPVVPDHQDRAGNGDRVQRLPDVPVRSGTSSTAIARSTRIPPPSTWPVSRSRPERTGTPGGAPQATRRAAYPCLSVAPTPGAGTVHADEGDDMTVEAANVRLSVIEQTWQAASAEERLGYLDELAAMAGTLGQVTGPQAENAEWLTRRLHRVVRHITHDPGQH